MKLLVSPGLPRSGTTYLFVQLLRHCSENFNAPHSKEMRLFHSEIGRDDFVSNFHTNEDGKFYFESTPTYLSAPSSMVENIVRFPCEEKKIIINLRAPIDQIYAHYLHDIKAHISTFESGYNVSYPLFSSNVISKYIKKRAHNVRRLVESVGKENVLFVHYPRDLLNPRLLENKLSNFLGFEVSGFSSERIGPGGWLPYYVYGGDNGAEVYYKQRILKIPPYSLLCVSHKESKIWTDVNASDAELAISSSSTWVRELKSEQVAALWGVVRNDWLLMLESLGIDRDDFPEPEVMMAKPASLEGSVLSELSVVESIEHRLRSISEGA